MKTKLLRKWNKMTRCMYAFGATWCMNIFQFLYFLLIKNTETRKLAKSAIDEFNEHYYFFHYLGYHIGPQVMLWHLHKDGTKMHDGRQNLWSKFAHDNRKYSKKWKLASSKLRRAIMGENDK